MKNIQPALLSVTGTWDSRWVKIRNTFVGNKYIDLPQFPPNTCPIELSHVIFEHALEDGDKETETRVFGVSHRYPNLGVRRICGQAEKLILENLEASYPGHEFMGTFYYPHDSDIPYPYRQVRILWRPNLRVIGVLKTGQVDPENGFVETDIVFGDYGPFVLPNNRVVEIDVPGDDHDEYIEL